MARLNDRLDNYLENFNKKNRLNIFVSSLGILFFILVAVILPFKYNLFSQLYQKVFTHAATLGNGDANNDGIVNGNDLKFVAQNVGGTVTGALDQYADGKINGFDFAQVAYIIQNPPTPTPTPGNGSPTPTPIPSTGEWTQFGHDPQHTNYTAQTVPTTWQYKWQWNGADGNGGTQTSHLTVAGLVQPITGGGRVYMAATNGVYAIDQSTGNVTWSNTSIGTLSATPVYESAGNLYVGSGNGLVYKLNASSGAVIASYTATGAVNLAPILVGSTLYIVAADGTLTSINTSNMTKIWSYAGGSPGATTAAYSPSRNILVYVTQDLYVHAVNVADGTRKWRVKPTPRTYECTNYAGDTCNVQYEQGAQAQDGWPAIAEQHGIVFIRYRLDYQSIFTFSPAPTTNAAIRTALQNTVDAGYVNPSLPPLTVPDEQALFALSLDTGAVSFVPAVMDSGSADGGNMAIGPVPVVANMGGQEVGYVPWRNGQFDPHTNGTDFRGDFHVGEMELDNTTVSGYSAGDLRFVKYQFYPSDETMQMTMAGNDLFYGHWLVNTGFKITDRSASFGSGPSDTSAIQTAYDETTIWREAGTGGPTCTFSSATRYCANGLLSFGDTRQYPAGFYEYFNTQGNGSSTSYAVVSNGLVLIKANDGAVIALQNGNPLVSTPFQQSIAIANPQPNVLGANTAKGIISYQEAPQYINQKVTVEGTIASAVNHLPKAVYLGFTNPHDGALLVRIFNKDISKFSYDPMTLSGKKVKVTGLVTLYWPGGKDPEIVVTDPSQIEVEQ